MLSSQLFTKNTLTINGAILKKVATVSKCFQQHKCCHILGITKNQQSILWCGATKSCKLDKFPKKDTTKMEKIIFFEPPYHNALIFDGSYFSIC